MSEPVNRLIKCRQLPGRGDLLLVRASRTLTPLVSPASLIMLAELGVWRR